MACVYLFGMIEKFGAVSLCFGGGILGPYDSGNGGSGLEFRVCDSSSK